jgi:alkylation response protein AidB-like acyl-CoA dehydrogenase
MRFLFGEDQLALQATVRDFLAGECPPARIRELWESESGRSAGLWAKLAELGIPGLLVPEERGGMGLDEVDAVLLHEEIGRAALAEPLVSTAAVAAPLLAELGEAERAGPWLERIAAGRAIVAVAHPASPLVADAHVAHLCLLARGDEVHAVDPADAEIAPQAATDPAQRLFRVGWEPRESTRLAAGARGRALQAAALDRGALACAAQLVGVADRLLEMASSYAVQRHQFGRPIGSFQAVKHQLASAKVALEYARPLVHRAAWSVARAAAGRGVHVSLAKVAAAEAAAGAARTALQVHGAIGYTWEQDLHIWMRRAWSLGNAWGTSAFHRDRVTDAVLDPEARLGPGTTFQEERHG